MYHAQTDFKGWEKTDILPNTIVIGIQDEVGKKLINYVGEPQPESLRNWSIFEKHEDGKVKRVTSSSPGEFIQNELNTLANSVFKNDWKGIENLRVSLFRWPLGGAAFSTFVLEDVDRGTDDEKVEFYRKLTVYHIGKEEDALAEVLAAAALPKEEPPLTCCERLANIFSSCFGAKQRRSKKYLTKTKRVKRLSKRRQLHKRH